MDYQAFGETDVGRQRDNNEDCYLARHDLGLFVVCDGMGGHQAGEVAAQTAAKAIEDFVESRRKLLADVARGALSHATLVETAVAAVQAGSRAVLRRADESPECAGMACTATLLLTAGSRAAMGHVGNTRLFLLRDGSLALLSTDHTLADEMMRRGELTLDEAPHSRYANAMTRCVGRDDAVAVDTLSLDVHPDDRFLLCSDGLTEYVDGLPELLSALGDEPATVPRTLIDLANERGGRDNVTAMLVVAVSTDKEQKKLLQVSKQRSQQLDALRAVPCLKSLKFADLLRVHNSCTLRDCVAGETAVRRGQGCDQLCVVVSGEFSLRSGDQKLRRLRKHDCVGDTTLLVRRECRSVLRAEKDGLLLVLRGEDLHSLARRRPWLGVHILMHLGKQLSEELEKTRELATNNGLDAPDTRSRRALYSFLSRAPV